MQWAGYRRPAYVPTDGGNGVSERLGLTWGSPGLATCSRVREHLVVFMEEST